VSVSESSPERVTLAAYVFATIHPLVEILTLKDPKFFNYTPKSQAIFITQDISIMKIKYDIIDSSV
jgi:hypothetical protein